MWAVRLWPRPHPAGTFVAMSNIATDLLKDLPSSNSCPHQEVVAMTATSDVDAAPLKLVVHAIDRTVEDFSDCTWVTAPSRFSRSAR